MAKLFLLRHLKSQWNLDNEFAGWVDNPLSAEGRLAAKEIAKSLALQNIDVVYTSPLIRNMETVLRVFEHLPLYSGSRAKYPLFVHLDGGKMQRWGHFTDLNEHDVLSYVSENLNERYYGALQGLNKKESLEKYGKEKIHAWRRDFTVAPPGGESLKAVYKRAVPFFKKYIEKELDAEKNVLLVASHNSLRTLVKYLENISDENIANVELPFGALMEYQYHNGKFERLQ